MTHIKGIVFDMDGVLIDSEPVHIDAWNEVFAEFGLAPFSAEWFHQWIGVSDKNFTIRVVQDYNLDVDPTEFVKKKRRVFEAKITESVRAYQGVKDGLGLLNRFGLAVATSSNRTGALMSLQGAQLYDFFKYVVTADDVANHKPSPDCYLKAAASLGFLPSECIGIEDSVSGIKAAKAAGMFVIGIATSLPAHYLTEADLVLPDTEGAIRWILEKCKSI